MGMYMLFAHFHALLLVTIRGRQTTRMHLRSESYILVVMVLLSRL